jgi:hypothetical protein
MHTFIKAVLLDSRGTLGEEEQPGRLVPYRPSTHKLLEGLKSLGLRIGVLTNVADDASPDDVKRGIADAVLDERDGKAVRIGDYIALDDIFTNKDLPAAKPAPEAFVAAACRMGVAPNSCLFMGENLLENVGALLAGMHYQLKPSPPGREFLPALQGIIGSSPVDSGRQFEAFLEHEHLLGERIFACGHEIGRRLGELTAGKAPPLNQGRWISPQPVDLPDELRRAMAFFVHLIEHFADQVHLKAEEALIEIAVACGMPEEQGQWVLDQHDQARAYWSCLRVAWRRIQHGDADDRYFALIDFQRSVEAFVFLFSAHALRENAQLYPLAGRHFNDCDDALVLNIIQHSGPSDITPYIGMVERMERLLAGP